MTCRTCKYSSSFYGSPLNSMGPLFFLCIFLLIQTYVKEAIARNNMCIYWQLYTRMLTSLGVLIAETWKWWDIWQVSFFLKINIKFTGQKNSLLFKTWNILCIPVLKCCQIGCKNFFLGICSCWYWGFWSTY